MRLASFNVENLFSRPKVMAQEQGDPEDRSAALQAHARVSELFQLESYDRVREEIIEQLAVLGLLRGDEGDFARLRKLRGKLLERHGDGSVTVVAAGRASWIGWVELKTMAVNEVATRHTAMVIKELGAGVMTVIEADSRPGLDMFSAAVLREVEGEPYEQVMVVEGNDLRGIDVGFLARGEYPLKEIRTHIFDKDAKGVIFSRDCCEYHLQTPGGEHLVIMANHFKSKGYSSPDDPNGGKKRSRQAARVADIYRSLRAEGVVNIAVMGDLNDDPSSEALAPLIQGTDLRDVSAHEGFDWNHRKGTYGSGNEKDKIDYILLSPALGNRMTGGGVFRKGVWRGSRTKDPWDIFPTLGRPEHAASDHAAIYADLSDF